MAQKRVIKLNNLNVVIIGGLHHNTLGVIRSLGETSHASVNMKVLLVGKGIHKRNIISESRYIKREDIGYVVSDEEIYDWLVEQAKDCVRRVIICCSDGSAEAVISHSHELNKWYDTPKTNYSITELMSKEVQSRIATECGLCIPQSKLISSNSNPNWTIFPCITKPEKSVQGKGKADIRISVSKEELQNTLETTDAEYVQVQEYISKKLEYQLIGCSLDAGKIIIIPGYTDIIRQPKNTNTGYLLFSPIQNFQYNKSSIDRFIKTIGYSGLFSIEFLRDGNGKDYFLEINLRNDGNAYCVKTAGVNLPYIWSYYQTYKTVPECPMNVNSEVYFIPDFLDMKMGIHAVGLRKWIEQFLRAQSHSLYNKKDMRPFYFELFRRIKAHLRK